MIFWRKFDQKKIKGKSAFVKGSHRSFKTHWWHYLTIIWKKVCVLKVYTNKPYYRLICLREDGVCQIYHKPIYSRKIRVGVRHEDCEFFAIDEEGNRLLVSISDSERNLDPKDPTCAHMLLV